MPGLLASYYLFGGPWKAAEAFTTYLLMVMQSSRSTAFDETPEHFRIRGFMRVRGAFSAQEAAAMRAAVWRVLERLGMREGDPSTWTNDRPTHLQELKDEPVFRAAWGPATGEAISQVMGRPGWPEPRSVGGFFIAFPSAGTWNVPSSGWHIDARYTSAESPPDGIRVHILMSDVEPKGGATALLAGSHRLVHRWFADHTPQPSARAGDHRRSLLRHPYVGALHNEASPEDRVSRFIQHAEEHDGIALQVVENVGSAGDVILVHPLLLHAASLNTSKVPRFLLSGAVDLPSMWEPRAAGNDQ